MIDYFILNFDAIAAGVISGLLIIPIIKTPKYFLHIYKFRNDLNFYIGDYYLYSFSTSGSGNVIKNTFSIRSKFGQLVCYENNNPFEFTGKLEITDSNIFVLMKGKNHDEYCEYVFHNTYHKKIRNLWGVGVGASVIKDPIAFRVFLTADNFTDDEIKEKFLSISKGKKCDKNAILVPLTHDVHVDNL